MYATYMLKLLVHASEVIRTCYTSLHTPHKQLSASKYQWLYLGVCLGQFLHMAAEVLLITQHCYMYVSITVDTSFDLICYVIML